MSLVCVQKEIHVNTLARLHAKLKDLYDSLFTTKICGLFFHKP